MPTNENRERVALLRGILVSMKSGVVAFSGGVDSTLLLRIACDTPGFRCVALTTSSPTTPWGETARACELAASFGAYHIIRHANELDTPGYSDNPTNRCYLCKQTLYPLCAAAAREFALAFILDGVNRDDLTDYRPGLAAASEFSVRHPLAEVGLRKDDIRALSRNFDLPTADQPASPCLSSRFPYGTHITEERLHQVAAAEAALHRMGFRELRVRHLGSSARVEIAAAEHPRLRDSKAREGIGRALRKVGFAKVEISKEPLRSGSLNDAIRRQNSAALNAKGSAPTPDQPG